MHSARPPAIRRIAFFVNVDEAWHMPMRGERHHQMRRACSSTSLVFIMIPRISASARWLPLRRLNRVRAAHGVAAPRPHRISRPAPPARHASQSAWRRICACRLCDFGLRQARIRGTGRVRCNPAREAFAHGIGGVGGVVSAHTSRSYPPCIPAPFCIARSINYSQNVCSVATCCCVPTCPRMLGPVAANAYCSLAQ